MIADSTIITNNQILRVSLGAHRGRVVVNVRYQWLAKDGRLQPDRRGVTFSACALPDVIEALEAVRQQMVKDGAIDDGNPPRFNPSVYPNNF
jgi:hypothetical protein